MTSPRRKSSIAVAIFFFLLFGWSVIPRIPMIFAVFKNSATLEIKTTELPLLIAFLQCLFIGLLFLGKKSRFSYILGLSSFCGTFVYIIVYGLFNKFRGFTYDIYYPITFSLILFYILTYRYLKICLSSGKSLSVLSRKLLVFPGVLILGIGLSGLALLLSGSQPVEGSPGNVAYFRIKTHFESVKGFYGSYRGAIRTFQISEPEKFMTSSNWPITLRGDTWGSKIELNSAERGQKRIRPVTLTGYIHVPLTAENCIGKEIGGLIKIDFKSPEIFGSGFTNVTHHFEGPYTLRIVQATNFRNFVKSPISSAFILLIFFGLLGIGIGLAFK